MAMRVFLSSYRLAWEAPSLNTYKIINIELIQKLELCWQRAQEMRANLFHVHYKPSGVCIYEQR